MPKATSSGSVLTAASSVWRVSATMMSSASQKMTYGVLTRVRPRLRAAPADNLVGERTTHTPGRFGRGVSEALSTTTIGVSRVWACTLISASPSRSET